MKQSSLSRTLEVLSLNHIMPGERSASLCYTATLTHNPSSLPVPQPLPACLHVHGRKAATTCCCSAHWWKGPHTFGSRGRSMYTDGESRGRPGRFACALPRAWLTARVSLCGAACSLVCTPRGWPAARPRCCECPTYVPSTLLHPHHHTARPTALPCQAPVASVASIPNGDVFTPLLSSGVPFHPSLTL